MQVDRSVLGALVVALVPALLLGGCAHRHETYAYGGSIKDGPVAAATDKVAPDARQVRTKVPTRRITTGSTSAPSVAAPKETAAAAGSASTSAAAEPVETPATTAPRTEPAPAPTGARAALASPADNSARQRAESDARVVSLQLLAEGQRLFSLGNVVEARKRFFAAMDGPVPDVLLALARSFDTHYLSQVRQPDGAPNIARAVALYERALERGATEAQRDIERIKGPATIPAAPDTPAPAAQTR
jgi:hypothetical protein